MQTQENQLRVKEEEYPVSSVYCKTPLDKIELEQTFGRLAIYLERSGGSLNMFSLLSFPWFYCFSVLNVSLLLHI